MVGGVAVNLRTYSRQTNLYPAQRFCFCGKVKLLQQQKDIVSFLSCDKSRSLVALILQSFIFYLLSFLPNVNVYSSLRTSFVSYQVFSEGRCHCNRNSFYQSIERWIGCQPVLSNQSVSCTSHSISLWEMCPCLDFSISLVIYR